MCRSEELMIRQKTGIERLLILWTGMRLYLCRECMHKFRAPDRRRFPRESKQGAEKAIVGVSPGHLV